MIHKILQTYCITKLNILNVSRKSILDLDYDESTDRGVPRTLSNILDGVFCENSQQILIVNYFCTTLYLRRLRGFRIGLWNIS